MLEDLARYHRQMLLPGFGEAGQRRLLESTALVLGCGALGTTVANMLARAGVGHLVVVDRDFIELTNLQRQVLFDEQDVANAIPKAEAAKRKLAGINSQVRVTAIVDDINYTNIERFADGVDVIVDGLDNFETRYLANDCAVKLGLPYVYGGAVGSVGMAATFLPHTLDGTAAWEGRLRRATPCFRCLFPEAPPPGLSPTCDTVGVLGPAVAIVANFQVADTLKLLTGNLAQVSTELLNIDFWHNTINPLKIAGTRVADCPCCVQHNFEFLDGKAGSSATSLCGRDAVQLTHKQDGNRLDFAEIARRLKAHGKVVSNEFMLRAAVTDNGKDYELSLFPDGRAIVKGTGDASQARSVYAKYVGT